MEMLIRIVDKPKSGDAALDSKRTTAGDVIAVKPDGHVWGKEEVRNPEWRIIRVPGMRQAEADALVSPELPESFTSNRMLRKRQAVLDVAQLDALLGGQLLAERTATPRGADANITRSQLVACRSLKGRLTDPRFIGPRKAVIGGD